MKLSPEEQWFLRRTIIRLYEKGFGAPAIADMLDVKNRHVQSTIKKYRDGGWEAVSLKTMGRPVGSNRALNPEQEEVLKETIMTKKPEAYGLKGFLWDMRNIMALVMIVLNISIPRSTMSKYFVRWGFTPQRPVIRNYKQNPEHVRQWIEETYPIIKARAQSEDAEIFWGDETGVQNTCNYVRGYAPKGEAPEAKLNSDKKLRVNLISAITSQGKLRFMIYEGKMNQACLIDFMKRLVNTSERKVFLILDNLSVHHGKIVKEWLERNRARIEVFYLPSYSPDLNPDEIFNGTLKREVVSRGNAKCKKEFISNVRASAMKIQRDKVLVSNLFFAPSVKYAS